MEEEVFSSTWQYINTHWGLISQWIIEHLIMVGIAAGIATVLGVSIGVYIAGEGREELANVIVNLAEIMLTIPSLALYTMMIPLLGAIPGVQSVGMVPAIIALVLYAQMPIIENTYTAIKEVSPEIIEAGRGMGMSSREILYRVKLPLAFPVIMAGLRNAIVMSVGIAALAVFVGGGGLGIPIFRGIRNLRVDLILTGAIFSSILAIVLDFLSGRIEQKLNWRSKGGGR
ncbi:ABC transporter permease [Candidatus Bipolaricaulota bacterium]|nr:ABC transporter permease [Candidatus Bipolaricaulota bacterium]